MIKMLLAILIFTTSIYSLQFTDAQGNAVGMNSFQGKKILLVNIASGSRHVGQLAGLQQLQQQYGDSLVVIAFPSNSFGKEPLDDTAIVQLCQTYGVSFRVAQKNPVAGEGTQAIYNWLSDSTQNGVMNNVPSGDFYKILIDGNGEIMGVFAPVLEPMDILIQNAITGTN